MRRCEQSGILIDLYSVDQIFLTEVVTMSKSEEMKRLEADMASDKELGKKFYETVDRIATENDQQSDGELFAKARLW